MRNRAWNGKALAVGIGWNGIFLAGIGWMVSQDASLWYWIVIAAAVNVALTLGGASRLGQAGSGSNTKGASDQLSKER